MKTDRWTKTDIAASYNYGRGMKKALIIINAEVNEQGKLTSVSPVIERMAIALQKGISRNSEDVKIETISVGSLWSRQSEIAATGSSTIYCPLTIQLPNYFNFPAQQIYAACRDVNARRRWVEKNLGYKTSVGESWLGHLWLPILVTDRGMLYGDIIGEGAIPNFYEQPVSFPETQRKSLYKLASNLLESLSATPSVYLLQFSFQEREIIFDRLWPFPAAPALASLRNREFDLFSCHWRCLNGQKILELENDSSKMPMR